LGGGGTAKNAYRLMQQGLNVITLPKTIDNDVWGTDYTFGFDTALGIATEAIDRLHSTAHSHHRIIVVEIMGHNTGWLALGSGVAGGADVILIPEIPFDIHSVADAVRNRMRGGSPFSIVAVSEGAMSKETAKALQEAHEQLDKADSDEAKEAANHRIASLELKRKNATLNVSNQLEELTGLESRVTILGHVQRGGTPSAADRLLASTLGTTCAALINDGHFGVMVAARGSGAEPVPLADVVGKRKSVPLDHPWLLTARRVGTCLGD
jgi:6-phosphofructokinase 1